LNHITTGVICTLPPKIRNHLSTGVNIASLNLAIPFKILYVDYIELYCVIELIGEWNDAIGNDIMLLKRDIIDQLSYCGINKFILIGENVLNFHASDDCYYEEWFEDADEGWIAFVNFREHVLAEFQGHNIDYYFNSGGELDNFTWRRFSPGQLFGNISKIISKRLE